MREALKDGLFGDLAIFLQGLTQAFTGYLVSPGLAVTMSMLPVAIVALIVALLQVAAVGIVVAFISWIASRDRSKA